MCNTATRQRGILRAQPHGDIKRGRVLHGVIQHLIVGERHVGVRKRNTAGFAQLRHLGELHALQALGQRTDGIHTRLVQVARAELEHFNQARFIQRRVGVRRAGETGDPAGSGSGHFRSQRGLVLKARLAQARRQIHQSGAYDFAGGVNGAVGDKAIRRGAHRDDLARRDIDITHGIDIVFRIDEAATLDVYLHPRQFPATMLITAMRMAMPKLTCGRMTDCPPSATLESISTPRFMGPGCSTMASGLARASFSSLTP